MTESEKKKIASLRTLGLGYKRIAEKTSLSRDAVRSFLKRSNVKSYVEKDNKCPCCGKELENIPHHRKKKFCCEQCRRKWWSKNQLVMNHRTTQCCLFCNTIFSSDRARKFCSRKCYISYRFGVRN